MKNRSVGLRLLKLIGLFLALPVVLLGVLESCTAPSGPDELETPDAAIYGCGSSVTWDVETTPEVDAAVAVGAVRWAFEQVEGPARLSAKKGSGEGAIWSWQSRLLGLEHQAGSTYLINRRIGGDSWVHVLDGDRAWTSRQAKTTVLRGILRDLGIEKPTSTADGLSKRDRAALRQVCNPSSAQVDQTHAPHAADADDVVQSHEQETPEAPKEAIVLLALVAAAVILPTLAALAFREQVANLTSGVSARLRVRKETAGESDGEQGWED